MLRINFWIVLVNFQERLSLYNINKTHRPNHEKTIYLISAAPGTEFALEIGKLKNEAFTYCVLETLDKYPEMKVSELKHIISKRVLELTNGMQKPTVRNETIAADWGLVKKWFS